MENWIEKSLSLGSVKENTDVKFNFKSTSKLKIKSIDPSCSSCTKIVGYEGDKLSVVFNGGKFPQHLRLEGKAFFDTTKTINVKYEDGANEDLYFRVRVYKN